MPTNERPEEIGSAEPPEDPWPGPSAAFAAIPGVLFASPPQDPASGGGMVLLYLAVSLGGLLVAAFGAIAVASLLGYSRTLLADEIAEELADEEAGVRDELHKEFARRDTEYLVTAFAFTVAGWILGLWALRPAVPPDGSVTVLVLYGIAMLLVTGSLPVAITRSHAERALLAVHPVIRVAWAVLRYPLVLPLLFLTKACLWCLRIKDRPANTAEVQKQVLAAVADSAADSLEDEERTWISNIVGLKDLQVSAIMTPRPDVIAFAEDTPLAEAIEAAIEHGFSRYPIYREKIDNVVGILYVKDALRVLYRDRDAVTSSKAGAMMRETLFVPEAMEGPQLLQRFQAGNQHMAIVLDEYGTTAGIVSVEDVLEEIVGDIADEYDEEVGEEPDGEQITVIEEGRVIEIPARATVEEVNELLGCSLPESGDWETIAGLVIARSNRIPAAGELVVVDDVEFRVLQADERRLHRLRATLLEAHVAEEPN